MRSILKKYKCPINLLEFKLIDYIEGILEKEEKSQITGHLSECRVCRGKISGLEKTIVLSKTIKKDKVEINPFITARIIHQLGSASQPIKRFFIPTRIIAFSSVLIIVVIMAFVLSTSHYRYTDPDYVINLSLINEYVQQNEGMILEFLTAPADEKEFLIYEKFCYFVQIQNLYFDSSWIDIHYNYMIQNLDNII